MDAQHEFERTTAHYADLAQEPGWRDYCRHRVQELEQSDCGMYLGLYAAVRDRIAAQRAADRESAN